MKETDKKKQTLLLILIVIAMLLTLFLIGIIALNGSGILREPKKREEGLVISKDTFDTEQLQFDMVGDYIHQLNKLLNEGNYDGFLDEIAVDVLEEEGISMDEEALTDYMKRFIKNLNGEKIVLIPLSVSDINNYFIVKVLAVGLMKNTGDNILYNYEISEPTNLTIYQKHREYSLLPFNIQRPEEVREDMGFR